MTYACQYAVVQFMPFVETGEVANIGVVLVCPEQSFLGFRVTTRGWHRISTFFSPLDRRIYRAALDHLEAELEHAEVAASGLKGSDALETLWAELVRSRGGVTRYGLPRALLTKDPALALSDLFGRYVERDFVTQAYLERRLEQTVRETLESAALGKRFRKVHLGTEDFKVLLPFVEFAQGTARKVIKPLNLAHDDPTHILNHGGDWLQRLHRLRRRKALPTDVLIAVSRPDDRGHRDEAFDEVCGDFAAQSFEVANVEDRVRIVEFAH